MCALKAIYGIFSIGVQYLDYKMKMRILDANKVSIQVFSSKQKYNDF